MMMIVMKEEEGKMDEAATASGLDLDECEEAERCLMMTTVRRRQMTR